MTEDEMFGWYYRLNRHEFEQALGDGEGQGEAWCTAVHGITESDITKQLNNNNILSIALHVKQTFKI